MADAPEDFSYVLDERGFVSLLIDLYRERPELWKVKHPNYGDKNVRARALESIVTELRAYKPDYTEEQVRKKINILRTNFNKVRHRIDDERQKGNEDVKPGLWYYNELLFLSEDGNTPNFGLRVSHTNSETADLSDTGDQKYESDYQEIQTPQTTQKKVYKKTVSIKRPRLDTEECQEEDQDSEPEPYMTVTTTYYKKKKTTEDILAKNWAMRLKNLVPEQRLFAEKIINDVLFEGELGNLTRNGVSFCPSF